MADRSKLQTNELVCTSKPCSRFFSLPNFQATHSRNLMMTMMECSAMGLRVDTNEFELRF